MRIGFTGTQAGMSVAQRDALRDFLRDQRATELHHGDCVGADAQADAVARSLGIDVVIHPPIDSSKRAFCARSGDLVWKPLPYLERNHDIVNASDWLVATPGPGAEKLRSGTWATVRYARERRRRITILSREGGSR